MFLKRLQLLFFLGISISVFSGGIAVSIRQVRHQLPNSDSPVLLIESIRIGSKSQAVNFTPADSSFANWVIEGVGFDGAAKIFVSKERGIGWQIGMGGDSLKVIIARDVKNTYDPRLISITTNFISGLFILENFAPECNSTFKIYALKNSWDADVEYTGKYALEMQYSNPCGEGQWKTQLGKLNVPDKVLYTAIFTAVMSQNIRALFKDYTL